MKLISFQHRDKDQAGILIGSSVLPVPATMNEVISNPDILRNPMDEIPLDALKLLAPIPHPHQDIICMGLNYTEHAEEAYGYSHQAFLADRDYPVFSPSDAHIVRAVGRLFRGMHV